MNIGYIGLGLMGRPCVENLHKAGHTIYIWARSPEKVQDILNSNIILCESPAEVAAKSKVVFTNLTDTCDVQEVIFSENGLAVGGANKEDELFIIDMSTISATATRSMAKDLEQKGIVFIDAPVSGGTQGAKDATLTVMVGASASNFEKVKPLLELLGSKVTLMGDTGAGQVAKSCNQIVITVGIMAVAEAFKLAEKLDVDPAKVREALLGGFAGSKILELHGLRMLEDNYAPGFKTGLHMKDMNIVAKMSAELGCTLPASMLGLEKLKETVEQGFSEVDSSAMYEVITRS